MAYELEIAGVVRMLEAAGIPARRRDRDARHPLVVAGGPLTFSNPAPLGAIVDAIVVGEADSRVVDVVRAAESAGTRDAQLDAVAAIPHVFVPSRHSVLPPVGAEHDAILPAHSAIRTPHTGTIRAPAPDWNRTVTLVFALTRFAGTAYCAA